jgi:hypothetical protein
MVLALALIALLDLPPQAVHLDCRNPGGPTETSRIVSADGTAVALSVSSSDDHSKNLHGCMATYELVITAPGGQSHSEVLARSDDDEWGRDLSIWISGFSHNGDHVFGGLAERGQHPMTWLLDYDLTRRIAQLPDLEQQFKTAAVARCGAKFVVIGTTDTGGVVLELQPSATCPTASRWVVNPSNATALPLARGASFSTLHR